MDLAEFLICCRFCHSEQELNYPQDEIWPAWPTFGAGKVKNLIFMKFNKWGLVGKLLPSWSSQSNQYFKIWPAWPTYGARKGKHFIFMKVNKWGLVGKLVASWSSQSNQYFKIWPAWPIFGAERSEILSSWKSTNEGLLESSCQADHQKVINILKFDLRDLHFRSQTWKLHIFI